MSYSEDYKADRVEAIRKVGQFLQWSEAMVGGINLEDAVESFCFLIDMPIEKFNEIFGVE